MIRVNVSDDCNLGKASIVGCLGNYINLFGSLEVYASVYGDVHGQVNSEEKMEVGVYVYSESDGINRFLLSGCSNLKSIPVGGVRMSLKGRHFRGGVVNCMVWEMGTLVRLL